MGQAKLTQQNSNLALYFLFLQTRRLPTGEVKELLSVGLACSECFSGPNLYRLLRPGFEYERKVMEDLMNGNSAAPLSIHTSSGVPEALSGFVEALEPHLPWKNKAELDWCVSLQLEGASAVWAAIDMLLQTQFLASGDKKRNKVAVGSTSYHGPPSTSFGSSSPLWNKANQVTYPVPSPGVELDEEQMISTFEDWLNANEDEIGVMLVEPQWGSSQAGLPWKKSLLKRYISMAQSRGIKVVADEIMCGLGRHGLGTLFVSEAWDLNPDAVTFGKAIGGGVFPISGAILKQGRELLQANKCSVMQSHTFAGSSTRALMTATEVLKEIPTWLPSVTKLGEEMDHIFRYLTKISKGMLIGHGQGLMWGAIFSRTGRNESAEYRANVVKAFKKHCDELNILPYYVPVGGFMVSPVIDIDVGTIYEIGERLEQAVTRTMQEVNWEREDEAAQNAETFDMSELATRILQNDRCQPILHKTRSCTSCSSFVSRDVRTRFFVNV
jgi:adenosylmethionine-8-amino-7-oxononanoate aminotransferase